MLRSLSKSKKEEICFYATKVRDSSITCLKYKLTRSR